MDAILAQIAEAPEQAGLLLDVDGVLAPIVPRPDDARVPEDTRQELRRLAGRYALVACVTGRASDMARRIVGVEELRYVGEHGLELHPDAAEWAARVEEFADAAPWPPERKRYSASFHWREAADEQAALAVIEQVAAAGEAAGFRVRWGRKVIDVVPPIDASKGTAVERLLATHPEVARALYAGDDTTDVDAFSGLERCGLELAVKVAIASSEGPAALREAADVVVAGPEAFLELLRTL